MKPINWRAAGVLFISLLLAACATSTVGHDFNDANLSKLQPGQTTLAQTVALLGAPPEKSAKTARGNWMHDWRFVRHDANGFAGSFDTQNKEVVLVFDGSNVLIGLLGSSGVKIDPATLQRIQAVPPTNEPATEPRPPVAAAPAAAAPATGKDFYPARDYARNQSCSASPNPVLASAGAGFEVYTVACDRTGDTLVLRCEWGNCRPMQ